MIFTRIHGTCVRATTVAAFIALISILRDRGRR